MEFLKEYLGAFIGVVMGALGTWLTKKVITKEEKKHILLEAKEKEVDLDDKVMDSYEKRAETLLKNIERLETAGEKMFNELINLRQLRIENSREVQEYKEKVLQLVQDLKKERENKERLEKCKDFLLGKFGCDKKPICEHSKDLADTNRHL